jgi:hypothetical protein
LATPDDTPKVLFPIHSGPWSYMGPELRGGRALVRLIALGYSVEPAGYIVAFNVRHLLPTPPVDHLDFTIEDTHLTQYEGR